MPDANDVGTGGQTTVFYRAGHWTDQERGLQCIRTRRQNTEIHREADGVALLLSLGSSQAKSLAN